MKKYIGVFLITAHVLVNLSAQDTTSATVSTTSVTVQTAQTDTSDKTSNGVEMADAKKEDGINWKDYLGIGAFASILSLLIGYLFKQNIDARIKNEAKKRVDEYEEKVILAINEHKKLIDKVMEQAGTEDFLLQNKRIWLIGESDRTLVKRVLKNVGFKTSNLLEEAPQNGYEILFINNPNGTLDLDELLNTVNNLPDKVFAFYFNTNQKHFKTSLLGTGYEDKVNFATNASQIYGNLLNTMKYQHRLG